jgi:hypothetical protein
VGSSPTSSAKRIKMEKTIEDKLKTIADYCDRKGISYTIDRNPSPEKIERIKASIKRKEELQKFFVERYKEGD